jgi:hypothetical protein
MLFVLSMLAAAGCTDRTLSSPETLVTGFYRISDVSLDGECATAADVSDPGRTIVEVHDDGALLIWLPSFGMSVAAFRRPTLTPVSGGFETSDRWNNDCGASIDWETFATADGASLEVTDITELRQQDDCQLRQAMPDLCTIEAVYDLELEEPCELPCTLAGEPLDYEPLHCSCPVD